jgi:hypothetical protein
VTISQCERSVTSTAVFPTAGGGSIPSRSLQSLIVEACPVVDVRAFIEQHHYSKSIKGVTPSHCFKVTLDSQMVGAAIFGLPGMRETLEKYSEFGKYKLVELRRFCMVDDTPRNSESRSISIMLRALRKQGVQRVLSYADPTYGHVGTIYKALGFVCLGQTPSCSVIIYKDRQVRRSSLDRYPRYRFANRAKDQFRKWSTRAVNCYANYQNKDLGLLPFAQEIRDALESGKAYKKKEAGKFIYLKTLFLTKPAESAQAGRASSLLKAK